ncbi:unnamed protein product [Ectocarpus sp. CCAP 1310/34]|nr:unnamed protein product [Ectocarpus sp. CCAP 1310/34]
MKQIPGSLVLLLDGAANDCIDPMT